MLINLDKFLAELSKKFDATPFNLGFSNTDSYIPNIDNESLVFICGRPSTGKSAFAIQLSINACKQGKKVLYLTTEMSEYALTTRIITNVLRIDFGILKNPMAYKDEKQQILSEIRSRAKELEKMDIDIWEAPHFNNADEFYTLFTRKVNSGEYGLIIIDYVQQLLSMCSAGVDELRTLNILSGRLQKFTHEACIPIVCVAQISRAGGSNEKNKPTISTIKGSGSFEQDADLVLLLYNDTENPLIKHIEIGKHRDGVTGDIILNWNGKHQRFYDKEEEYEEHN